jgi:2-C-methyl-D-erythritol 2,4-cyclodiphosphate synthase
VERVLEPEDLKSMSAVIESQRQLEDVVEDLLSSVHGVPKKRGSLDYDTEEIP